jgi:hypothetical protein
MPEGRPMPQEQTLAELTGRQVDADAFYLSLAPRLHRRNQSLFSDQI